jgi:hypothetical protein
MSDGDDNANSEALCELKERLALLPGNHRKRIETAVSCVLNDFPFTAGERSSDDYAANFCDLRNGECVYQSKEPIVTRGANGHCFYECLRGEKMTLLDIFYI